MLEEPITAQEQTPLTTEKYLTFFIRQQRYGIPISRVKEIIGVQAITEVPEFPHYAKGIINLRGLVVPVIDVNLRIGYEEQPYGSRTCIIIVDVDEMEIGLIVDAVDEVLDIDQEVINDPPEQGDPNEAYVQGIAVLEEKLILIMSCRKIIGEDVV